MKIIPELPDWGFNIELVLADSLYGESKDVIKVLNQFNLPFIVAIRSNHKWQEEIRAAHPRHDSIRRVRTPTCI